MSVTGPKVRVLFCEGNSESYDSAILNRLLEGKPPGTLIVPVGGKYGLRSFMLGWSKGQQLKSSVVGGPPSPDELSKQHLAFRDRDFDAEPPDDVRLITDPSQRPDKPMIFFSHRAAIENYLLDVQLIDQYWKESRQNGPAWKHGDSPGPQAIIDWRDESARDIASYSAVRWALSSLKPAARWPELNTTWTDGSGQLPTSLLRDDCWKSACELVQTFRKSVENISEERLRESFDSFDARFAMPRFITDQQYLIWFHGKDLLKAMQKRKPNGFSLGKSYIPWALSHLSWKSHPDLDQLATML